MKWDSIVLFVCLFVSVLNHHLKHPISKYSGIVGARTSTYEYLGEIIQPTILYNNICQKVFC